MSTAIARPARQSLVTSLSAGALFAVGLTLAGMGHPSTVLDAFRLDASWDPRLFSMFFGAILVHAPFSAWLRRRGATLRDEPLTLPPARRVDGRLVIGAVIFGVGWGLGGLCPGPAFLVLLTGAPHAATFFAGMTCGFCLHHLAFERTARACT